MERIRKEFFSEIVEFETPAGNIYISNVLQAINKNKYEPSMGSIYSEVNQHILFTNGQDAKPTINNFDPNGPSLVTYNKNSGKIGIMTGKIILELKSDTNINVINQSIKKYQLEVIYEAKQINTYYLELLAPQDLEVIITSLRSEDSVKRADIEVIENINRPL